MSDINMHSVCEISSNVATYQGFKVYSFTAVNSKGHKMSVNFYTDDTEQLVIKETTHRNYCELKDEKKDINWKDIL